MKLLLGDDNATSFKADIGSSPNALNLIYAILETRAVVSSIEMEATLSTALNTDNPELTIIDRYAERMEVRYLS
jgi:hypothetical protein